MAGLRKVAEGKGPPDRRLTEITELVARELEADVCSCFVLRAGDLLEPLAMSGPEAFLAPRTMAPVGEGLIGEIVTHAVSLDISDASSHPSFSASLGPSFEFFCGVPILRGGAVRGVLAVRNRAHCGGFGAGTVDVLQAAAMVAAELIVSGGIVTMQEISSSHSSAENPTRMDGAGLGRGMAAGYAVLYEPRLLMQDIVADDSKAQILRLREAVAGMQESISRMLRRDVAAAGTETRDILEAYGMFARDRGWLSRIEAAVDKGLSAEAAVQSILNETRARMAQMEDAYIRERLQDIEDVSNRLLSYLMHQRRAAPDEKLPDDIILVARSMGPAALLDYDRSKLKGVVLERGGRSDHVAIVARSLGIPVVGQCKNILDYTVSGDHMIVNGDLGVVYLRPSQYVVDLYSRSVETRARRASLYRKTAQDKPSQTKDGVKVSVQINAGLLEELKGARQSGAEGIGLFRTELSFMGFKKYPMVAMQAELYGKVLDQMEGKPVVFRTLDIGGDKPLPYFKPPEEENPALGWRAVRIGMDRPAVLRTQFRALIQASKGRNIKIMLPLVTEVAEYDRARQFLEMEKTRALKGGVPVPEKIELGVMIEVPSLLWQMDALLQTVDFVSVGTNDLMQYLYAADRGSGSMRDRYDPLSPAMLCVLKTIVEQCRAAGVPVSVCGEMAGHPLEAMVLVALGYQSLSVSPQSVETVKMMIPTLDAQKLLPYLEQLIKSREHSLRGRLLSFARDNKVNIS